MSSEEIVYKEKGKDFVGPSQWVCMHCYALNYDGTEEYFDNFVTYLWSITKLFNCLDCRRNLEKKLNEIPPEDYRQNRDSLFLLTYTYHDIVNQYKGVKSPPFEKAKEFYLEKIRTKGIEFIGGPQWLCLHAYAAGYVPGEKSLESPGVAFINYVNTLKILLPDKDSRENLSRFLQANPVYFYLGSSDQLFLWTYLYHDWINTKLNKNSTEFAKTKLYYLERIDTDCLKCKI